MKLNKIYAQETDDLPSEKVTMIKKKWSAKKIQINKENLKKKIIPSLLFDKTGRSFEECVRKRFEKDGPEKITYKEIKDRFDEIGEDYKHTKFWTFFLEFFNDCYGSSVGLRQATNGNSMLGSDSTGLEDNLSDEELESLISELQRVKFDETFKEQDSIKIKNKELLHDFLYETYKSSKGVIYLSDKNTIRLVVPNPQHYYANADLHQPKGMKEYPNIFLKLEGNKLSLDMPKLKRNAFFKKVEEFEEDSGGQILEEFNQEHLESLKIDAKFFFRNLRSRGLIINKLKLLNPSLYFNIGLRELIDIEDLIDIDFFMNSKMDIIYFQKIDMTYPKLTEKNKKVDFKFSIRTEVKRSGQNNSVKFMITFSKNADFNEKIKKEIIDLFKQEGLCLDRAYELPTYYYVNEIMQEKGSLESNYNKIIKLEPNNNIINKLIEEKILNVDEFSLDSSKLKKFKNNILSKLKGKSIELNEDIEYKIKSVHIDKKNRQNLVIRRTNNSDDTETYKVILHPFVRGSEKITSVVIQNMDYSSVIEQILNEKEDLALKFICKRVEFCLKKHQIVLEKEANISCELLKRYMSNKDMDPEKIGNQVEKEVNILLKYIYKNFLSIGGSRAPDGYLTLLDEHYLLDSKYCKVISQTEYDKMIRYLSHYPLSDGLEETKNAVFIISRDKIKESLNPEAKKSWSKYPELNIGYLTLEFLIKIFDILKTPKIGSDPKIVEKIFRGTQEIIKKSYKAEKIEELERIEDTILKEVSDSLKEIKHTPQRKNQK